jgi:uncharacterized protein YeaO (DUF488 family)
MAMTSVIRTKRWNDPREPDDGFRVLICRYRPRGVKKEDETWDAWCPALAPSVELHAAAYGKEGAEPIAWSDYEKRFREEMSKQGYWLNGFAENVKRGETITLLCSSACTDEARCHRTLVKAMLEERAAPKTETPARTTVVRRR